MPFSRYLQSNERENHTEDELDHHAFSTQVHFQLPNLFNAPAVPPGGGAEALPAGLCPPSASLAWFNNQEGYHSAFPVPSSYHAISSASSSSSPQSATSAFPVPALPAPYHGHQPGAPPFNPQLPLSVPSALGLPIYSSSGFDLLSLLARVATRPYPKIYLGPVDLSCSFVVTDTRRFDAPIVYASPSFLKLTGYDEHEVIGRNCRFLQAPGGVLQRGQDRMHTSREAVNYMRKNIIADKECQVSVINYRKDGSAFINMVSVIPLRGGVDNTPDEADDVVYHIGFQVDLTEQPKSILSKLKDGTYVVNYSDQALAPSVVPPRDWRTSSLSMRGMSKDLRALLSDPAFTASFQLSTSTHASTAIALSSNPAEPVVLDPYDGNKPLHMFILDRSPDFLHVVSLKGAFLYMSPAVRHVLGYDPDELVGRSLSEFCHPADCVPLMRELKEASVTPGPSLLTTNGGPPPSSSLSGSGGGSPDGLSPSSHAPRPVDLLFRMQAKGRGYVWVECRGRLHVEPGKGRKAIILSGRVRHMPRLEWGPISRAGGLVPPMPRPQASSASLTSRDADEETDERSSVEREFWGLLSTNATFLYVGAAVRDVLGWGTGEVIGKSLADFVTGNSPQEVQMAIEVEMTKVLADAGGSESSGLACDALTKGGAVVSVHVVLYRSRPLPSGGAQQALGSAGDSAAHAPIVCQVKLCDGSAGAPPPANPITHPLAESVFQETEIERGSSWQYELQQQKFRNQRLAEEVQALEAVIAKKMRRKQPPSSAPTSAVAGPSAGVVHGRSHSGPSRMTEPAYAPPPEPPMHASQPQQQIALNVRFVSNGHGYPRTAPTQASRTYHTTAPPQPPLSHTHTHAHAQRTAVQQQLPPPPMAPPSSSQSYEAAQLGNAAMYPPPRIQHSTESSLQGWSAYYEQTDHGGGGGGAGGGGGQGNGAALHGRPGSFSGVPMKRTWDDLLRDPGGGGA